MENKSLIIQRLTGIIPPDRLITDSAMLHEYDSDHAKGFAGHAGLAVLPANTPEVTQILRLCNELNYPVYTRGAGTGVTGAASPLDGGLVLSCEKMNRILEIDRDNLTATVEPYVITGDLQKEAEKNDLFYPPDPASLEECTIAGNVSQNAGGPRAVKYGVTKDYVLGMECVLADGSIIRTGGKYVKNATGYNLGQLITGSEGTLCVITKLIMKLIPRPLYEYDLLLPFASLEDAVNAVGQILHRRVVPATVEFVEDEAIRLVNAYRKGNIPFAKARAHLIIKIDAHSQQQLDSQLNILTSASGVGKKQIIIARTAEESEEVWTIRRGIRDALDHFSPVFLAEDCVVPRAEIPRFITSIKSRLNSEGLNSVLFGHAGDGNIHIDVLKYDMNDEEWKRRIDDIRAMIYAEALGHGGQISGEHGIGYTKKEYLEQAVGKREYTLMREIKQLFDPKNILNRGKLFL